MKHYLWCLRFHMSLQLPVCGLTKTSTHAGLWPSLEVCVALWSCNVRQKPYRSSLDCYSAGGCSRTRIYPLQVFWMFANLWSFEVLWVLGARCLTNIYYAMTVLEDLLHDETILQQLMNKACMPCMFKAPSRAKLQCGLYVQHVLSSFAQRCFCLTLIYSFKSKGLWWDLFLVKT